MRKKRKINYLRIFLIIIILISLLLIIRNDIIGRTVYSLQEYFDQRFTSHIQSNDQHKMIDNDNTDGDIYTDNNFIAVYDLDKQNFTLKNNIYEQVVPASLAKLFTIKYALKYISSLDENILVTSKVINKVKKNSSLAYLHAGMKYHVKDIIVGMLLPSGNDAAYVLADYIGQKINPKTNDNQQTFIDGLNSFLANNGYYATKVYDPSGYSNQSRTNIIDLVKVCNELLKYKWFRDIISTYKYSVNLNNGQKQIWYNSNELLNPHSIYYHKDVKGIKTGTLNSQYHLLALYKNKIIVKLGAISNEERYNQVIKLFN